MKNKIAIIGLKGIPAYGGAATVGENIIAQLKDKYDFTVYATSTHTKLKTGQQDGFFQIVFAKIFSQKINTLYYYIISVLHALLFGKYDLIHLHHRDAAFLIILLKLKYKVVVTTHGVIMDGSMVKWRGFEWYFNLQVNLFLKYADKITCVSITEQNFLSKRINLHVDVIPNGVNILNEVTYPTEKDFIFFSAGRIISTKGCHVLLSALKKIHFQGNIIIAGNVEHEKGYYEELKVLSKGLNVTFKGLIKKKELLYGYLCNARFFVFPSQLEAMSIMLLEAASQLCPVICSDIEANMDVFDKEEVLFFETNSVESLSEKLIWALQNEDKMTSFAKNAYNRCQSEYSWQRISEKYSEIFDNLIEKENN
jgi:glycosyltransferase involved in cell wall biosynthesis